MDTKERILLECIRLFGERGYERVSMRQIAAAVGIKESSIYNHYSSKAEILDHIIAHFRMRHVSYIPTLKDLKEWLETETLEQALGHYLYSYDEEEYPTMVAMFRIVFMEQYRDEKLRDVFLNHLVLWQTRLMEEAFDYLHQRGLLEDCAYLANIWVRSLLVLSMEACQNSPQDLREYGDTMSLYISFVMHHATPLGRSWNRANER